jgi:hypothetical protein
MSVKIPISNQPNQSFEITLPQTGANLTLGFFVYWNRISGYWQMNITDVASDTELLTALPLLRGQGFYQNLLAQWDYLNIGQLFIIPLSSAVNDSPGLDDWDTNFTLVWGPNAL